MKVTNAMTDAQEAFLDEVGKLVIEDTRRSGVLASLTLAQAILESDWGTSGLTEQANALFGIKASASWTGRVYSAETQECYDGVNLTSVTDYFRAYDSWADSVADHSALLTHLARYSAVVGERNYLKACEAIQTAGYATDPRYAEKLIQIIEAYHLTIYDRMAEKADSAAEEAADAQTVESGETEESGKDAEEADGETETAGKETETAVVKPSESAQSVSIPMPDAEFIARLQDIVDNYKTLYVMGCFGAPLIGSNVDYYLTNHTYNKQRQRGILIRAAADQDPPVYGFDCVCLIKGVLWGWTGNPKAKFGGAKYESNGVPDIGADMMITKCRNVSTDFSAIVPGEAVWTSGHIGVYIGGGMVIECSPAFENRVQVTECRNIQKTAGLNGRKWTRHGKLPYISYSVEKIVPGATVRYSGPLYSQSDGGTPGKSVNGEFTVEYYRNDKACGVHLEDLGWVPASDCVVMD